VISSRKTGVENKTKMFDKFSGQDYERKKKKANVIFLVFLFNN